MSTVGVRGLTCLGGALIKASDIISDSEWSSLNNIGIIKLDHRHKGFHIITCGLFTVYITSFQHKWGQMLQVCLEPLTIKFELIELRRPNPHPAPE